MAKFTSPKKLLEAYNAGFVGAYCDPKAVARLLESLPEPNFKTAGRFLRGTGAGKLSTPYMSIYNVCTDKPFTERQTTGDCVSHGTRNALDVSRAVQIDVNHELGSFGPLGATEGIYGSRGHGGQGMSCAGAAEWVKANGLLVRKNYEGVIDLTTYDADIGSKWGSRGVPANVEAVAKLNPVGAMTQVNNIEDARDALANGYGISVCSNQGFSSTRDNKGFSKPEGSWNHCYLGDTFISGPTSKEIRSVLVGDYVYSHNGTTNKVVKVLERTYSGNVINIKAQNLPSFKVTAAHPILVARKISREIIVPAAETADIALLVQTKLKNRELIWVAAQDITTDDMLVTPHIQYKNIEPPALVLPTQRSKKLTMVMSDNLAWVFGLFIADGNAVKNHKIVITLAPHEMAMAEKVKKSIKEAFGLETHIYEKANCLRVTVYSSVLAHNFKLWFGANAATKHIPEFLLNYTEVVDGIFAGDGCWHRNAKKINTVSRELAYQLFHRLVSLGEHPSIHLTKTSVGTFKNAKQGYAVQWVEDSKQYKGINEYEYYYLPVKSVMVEVYEGKVYNLEVANTHTYIADGLATHNCMAWIACDDTGSEPAFLVQNSWGKFNDGGHPEWGQIPDGSFLIHADVAQRMLSSDSSFAFSAIKNFEPVKLPSYSFEDYL